MSLFWTANALNEIIIAFQISLNPDFNLTIAFWKVKSWYTDGDPELGFQCFFKDGINQKFSSVCGSRLEQHTLEVVWPMFCKAMKKLLY